MYEYTNIRISKNFIVLLSAILLPLILACSSSPSGLDVSTLDAPARDAAERAAALVCEKLSLRMHDLELVRVEAVEWPDASLGFPKEGMMYAQVITPGHKVIFKTSDGRIVEVHTSARHAVMK